MRGSDGAREDADRVVGSGARRRGSRRARAFYSGLFGWPVSTSDDLGAAIQVPGTNSYVSFQRAEGYVPPTWPAEAGRQQMMLHLDVAVDDLDAAATDAVALGATLAALQPQEAVRVQLDPEGHPFCLYLDGDATS
jgi:predicted enzyme related to lactoylglutathione lyase